MTERFSGRFGYEPGEREITIRENAPYELRGVLVDLAYEYGLPPHPMRTLVCRILRTREDESNWSAYPNVDGEVRQLLDRCEWYEVYDIAEEVYRVLQKAREAEARRPPPYFQSQSEPEADPDAFQRELNNYFKKNGIGWQLKDGLIQVRGSESFETSVATAKRELEKSNRQTAAAEIHEALKDLSRRPDPDITGAIQHGMAALECTARDVVGDQNPTLGDLLKKNPGLLPPPLDQAVTKAWGFASETGRHLKEGQIPDYAEAELVVGLSAVLCTYLAKKKP